MAICIGSSPATLRPSIIDGYTRDDPCSYVRHRPLFDGFAGRKRELTPLATAR